MKLSCNVMDDLLPLYADGACGQETAALVEAHLADCPRCRAMLEQMRTPEMPEETVQQRRQEAAALKKSVLAGIRQTVRGFATAAFALVFLALVTVAGTLGYQTWWTYTYDTFVRLPVSDVEVEECEVKEDGTVCFVLRLDTDLYPTATGVETDEEGNYQLYILCYRKHDPNSMEERLDNRLTWGTFAEGLGGPDGPFTAEHSITLTDADGNELVIYDRDAQ
ncbi:MAG: zf-HC2 domain-containing protein [Clostridiales bacterium]|nr:zf-HC2 domain-containing protein [Clostridiales bacterium]